jgi:predicted DCC family thiol-disulfide oxidoreductase YuxK
MPTPRLTVWYNTRCPICDAGIDRQRNKLIAAVQAGALAFSDINETPQALAAHGVSLDDVRRRLHATDADGRLLVGADVALALWAYDRFADALFAWNRRKGRW